jgi:hypothetical protein
VVGRGHGRGGRAGHVVHAALGINGAFNGCLPAQLYFANTTNSGWLANVSIRPCICRAITV